eukprot:1134814-Amorphochlora_amoeboformis.AAC.1
MKSGVMARVRAKARVRARVRVRVRVRVRLGMKSGLKTCWKYRAEVFHKPIIPDKKELKERIK